MTLTTWRTPAHAAGVTEATTRAFWDLFAELFGEKGRGGDRDGDRRQNLVLSPEEADAGSTPGVAVTRRVRCAACKVTGDGGISRTSPARHVAAVGRM
jgi:hypothetical protein